MKVSISKSVKSFQISEEWTRVELEDDLPAGKTIEEYLDDLHSRALGWILKTINSPSVKEFHSPELKPEEVNKEWEQFKIDALDFMGTIPTKSTEEVIQWLKNNGWYFSIEAKQFIKQISPTINL